MKHKIILAAGCIVLAAIAAGCGGRSKKADAAAADAALKAEQDSIAALAADKQKKAEEIMKTLPEEPVFDIVTNMGTIKVKLYSKTPKHRDNFEKLALSGYYDGLLFHRVIDGFMIQGGDPNTRDKSPEGIAKYGQGGPGYTVPAEFIPEYRHKKGALAAAVQEENACAQLDGAYTVYGETIEGLDVIDRIAKVATDGRDRPVSDVVIKKVMLDK